MIKLTEPDGTEFLVKVDAIDMVRPNTGVEYPLGPKSVILVGGMRYAIKEDVSEICKIAGWKI